jgi:hypothetical protein
MLNNDNNNNNNNNNEDANVIVINDPNGGQQDRVVRFLFMAWIIYSLMWRAPDAAELARNQPLSLDVPIANDGRAVRNMQLFRNASSSVALLDFFVPRGDKERLAASLRLSARIVHRATPFRPIPGAIESFYQHDESLFVNSSSVTAAQWAALRQRIVASVRPLSSLNVWALMFKLELGTDMACVGVCERGGDRHCVGVPDLYEPSRCWMPVDDECSQHHSSDVKDVDSHAEATQEDGAVRRDACYGLVSHFFDGADAKRDDIATASPSSDLHFRWFANRTCVANPRSCGSPIARLRGDVARAIMYGELAYGESKTPGEFLRAVPLVYFEWADIDPVDDVERRRNELLYAAQRTRNPWVDFAADSEWQMWRTIND